MFDEKKMTRQLDELEHKYKCQIERRNRLMKELNHLKEINQVYEAVDAEMWGSNWEASSNGSDLSFISTLRKPMTPMRYNNINSPAIKSLKMGTMRSSSGMMRNTTRDLTKTLQNSPSVKSAKNFNPMSSATSFKDFAKQTFMPDSPA
jgi:hypothetical protein